MECGYFTPEIYTAGSGIDITNNVISATGGAAYTAGDGIEINNNTISAVLPECPTTTDSTFQLQCVVSNGVATYSWVDVAPHPILTNFWLGTNGTEVTGNGNVTGEVNQEGNYIFT